MASTVVRKKGVITIPQEIRDALHLEEGDHLLVTVEEGRMVVVPASLIPRDQAWFWTPEWIAKEREVDEAIERGDEMEVFLNDEDMLRALADVAGVDLADVDPDEVR